MYSNEEVQGAKTLWRVSVPGVSPSAATPPERLTAEEVDKRVKVAEWTDAMELTDKISTGASLEETWSMLCLRKSVRADAACPIRRI